LARNLSLILSSKVSTWTTTCKGVQPNTEHRSSKIQHSRYGLRCWCNQISQEPDTGTISYSYVSSS